MNTRPSLDEPIRLYEELEGGQGRSIFFRPHRYREVELRPLHAELTLELEGEVLSSELADISQGGVGLWWTRDEPRLGTEVMIKALRFGEHIAYHGLARVGSLRWENNRLLVGIEFSEKEFSDGVCFACSCGQ